MGLFVVFYIRKIPLPEKVVLTEFMKAMMGPVVHVETVFVSDYRCDCLNINMDCPEGFAMMQRNRSYEETREEKCKYVVRWVKIRVSERKECIAKTLAEIIVRDRKFQMCQKQMMASLLPRQMISTFDRLYNLAFYRSYEPPKADHAYAPQYCAGLCLYVLKEGCGLTHLPEACSAGELLDVLTNVKKFPVCDWPFPRKIPHRVKDHADIIRSEASLAMIDPLHTDNDLVEQERAKQMIQDEWGFSYNNSAATTTTNPHQ